MNLTGLPPTQIKKLAKSEDADVAAAAAEVVEAWKSAVKKEQAAGGDSLARSSSGQCFLCKRSSVERAAQTASRFSCLAGLLRE